VPTSPTTWKRTLGPLLVVTAVTVVACHHGTTPPPDPFSSSSLVSTPTFAPSVSHAPTASPTPPAIPPQPPARSGPVSASCVEGWRSPAVGSKRYEDPLDLIDKITHHKGRLKIVDIRYFVGPESPPSDQGYIERIERWYVKVYDPTDIRFQGRFLLEHIRFGHGVVAVAPYDTKGFKSPDWSGFQWDAGDLTKRAYPGLPGTWEGIRYDFVNGGAGLNFPGLPSAVTGCLAGT
jgi:hypothetical protein